MCCRDSGDTRVVSDFNKRCTSQELRQGFEPLKSGGQAQMKCSLASGCGFWAEQRVMECSQGADLSAPFPPMCVLLSWQTHKLNTQMHSSEVGEEPDRAQYIAGSPTVWLGALSPICS